MNLLERLFSRKSKENITIQRDGLKLTMDVSDSENIKSVSADLKYMGIPIHLDFSDESVLARKNELEKQKSDAWNSNDQYLSDYESNQVGFNGRKKFSQNGKFCLANTFVGQENKPTIALIDVPKSTILFTKHISRIDTCAVDNNGTVACLWFNEKSNKPHSYVHIMDKNGDLVFSKKEDCNTLPDVTLVENTNILIYQTASPYSIVTLNYLEGIIIGKLPLKNNRGININFSERTVSVSYFKSVKNIYF